MKRIASTLCAALFSLSFTSSAMAYNQQVNISEIKVQDGNKTLISFSGITWHGCGGTNFFVISEGDPVPAERQQMLVLALAALTTGRSIYVVTGGCDGNGYEWVQQISIYP